jgi:hypothetical protein
VVVLPTADGKGAGDVEDAPATGTPVHGVGGGSVLDVYASTGVDGTIFPSTTPTTPLGECGNIVGRTIGLSGGGHIGSGTTSVVIGLSGRLKMTTMTTFDNRCGDIFCGWASIVAHIAKPPQM